LEISRASFPTRRKGSWGCKAARVSANGDKLFTEEYRNNGGSKSEYRSPALEGGMGWSRCFGVSALGIRETILDA
jgi:hypothetical protein